MGSRVRRGAATPDDATGLVRSHAAIDPLHLPGRSYLEAALLALGLAVSLAARNYFLFTTAIHENTDYAANSILVGQATRFDLLVGNYSRIGFHHPGPAFLYIQSFGQDVFYSLLHVVPARYNGQLLALYLLNALLLSMGALSLFRHLRSRALVVGAIGIELLLVGGHALWASSWMPFLYVAPFFAFVVTGTSVALGAREDLPLAVFSGGLLVHGHIAFSAFVAASTVAIVVVRLATRRRRPLPASTPHWPRWLSWLLIALYVLPIAVETGTKWPGQWKLYWSYVHSNSKANPHTLAQAASYVAGFWGGTTTARALLLAAGALAAALAAFDRDPRRRALVIGLLASTALMTVGLGLYGLKGVDQLSLVYTGYFYFVVPPLCAVAAFIAAAPRVVPLVAAAGRRLKGTRPKVPQYLAAASCLVVLGWAVSQSAFYYPYRGDPQLPAFVRAIEASPLRHGRDVVLDLGLPGAPVADWWDTTGFLVQASRSGYDACVSVTGWTFMMTDEYICSGTTDRRGWHLVLEPATAKVPAHSTLIWRDATDEAYTSV